MLNDGSKGAKASHRQVKWSSTFFHYNGHSLVKLIYIKAEQRQNKRDSPSPHLSFFSLRHRARICIDEKHFVQRNVDAEASFHPIVDEWKWKALNSIPAAIWKIFSEFSLFEPERFPGETERKSSNFRLLKGEARKAKSLQETNVVKNR